MWQNREGKSYWWTNVVLLYLTDCSFGFCSTPFPTHFHSPSSAQLDLETSQAEPFRVQYDAAQEPDLSAFC